MLPAKQKELGLLSGWPLLTQPVPIKPSHYCPVGAKWPLQHFNLALNSPKSLIVHQVDSFRKEPLKKHAVPTPWVLQGYWELLMCGCRVIGQGVAGTRQ